MIKRERTVYSAVPVCSALGDHLPSHTHRNTHRHTLDLGNSLLGQRHNIQINLVFVNRNGDVHSHLRCDVQLLCININILILLYVLYCIYTRLVFV